MHWKEAARKFTDFQATKMLVLRQLRALLFHLIQSLTSVNALQKILAVIFYYKFNSAAFTLVEYHWGYTKCPRFLYLHQCMLSAMIVANF